MALRLVRQTSDTPNITNKDDTIMVRYAYGGYNGVVKGFGSELGYDSSAGNFRVLDGRIVIDGWEVDVDGAGWLLNLSAITGTQYHSVYAEVDVAVESVKIDTTFLPGAYPEIAKGDDLTEVPNGKARLLLYNIKVDNGTINEIVKKFEIVPYLTQKVIDIEKRLDELGFKQGVAEILNTNKTPTVNSLKKQGKYVIFSLEIESVLGDNDIRIPLDFAPKETTQIIASWGGVGNVAVVNTDGTVMFFGQPGFNFFTGFYNCGWETL